MPSPLTVIYEFDRFRLDRGNHRLTRDGLLLNTPGRTFPLLLTLIENREQVLSVEKLVNSFFPKSPFGEEELSAEILQLKRLLDDTSKNAPLVRTLAGKGYQFEAEVMEYLGDSSGSGQMGGGRSSASAPAEEYRPPAKKSSVMLGIGIAAAVVAVLAVAGWFFFMRPHGGSSSGDGSSFSSSIYDGHPM